MTGEILGREAVLWLDIAGDAGSKRVRVIIDTGFTEWLTVPSELVRELQLPFRATLDMELADGSICAISSYDASVIWHGVKQPVIVLQTDGDPLLGMGLLQGSRLTMEVVDGASVSIERLE